MPKLNARALKCTVVLDPLEIAAIGEPHAPRVVLHVRLPDRTVSVDINAKSLRKAQATIAEHGPEGVACVIQGKLLAGDMIAEAGLVAQPKAPKVAVSAAA